MLPTEIIPHPTEVTRSRLITWGAWFGINDLVRKGLGPKWYEKLVRDWIADLYEYLSAPPPPDLYPDCEPTSASVMLWTLETSFPEDGLALYMSYAAPSAQIDWLQKHWEPPEYRGTALGQCEIPGEAVPLAIRQADGTMVRLWPQPGPRLPKKQQLKVDWTTFWVLNKCFAYGQNPHPGIDPRNDED